MFFEVVFKDLLLPSHLERREAGIVLVQKRLKNQGGLQQVPASICTDSLSLAVRLSWWREG